MTRRLRTLALATTAVLAGLLALAGPASAHVTVSAPGAVAGGSDEAITFRVPSEEPSATVAVTIALPLNHPIASVLVQPLPGWTHTETTVHLNKPIRTDDGDITTAVSRITWKASAGNGIKPGEYGSFTILAGLLPDVPRLSFGAVQTYANGDVVRWIEHAAPGSHAVPEHPAPVLKLTTGASPAATSVSSGSSSAGATVLAIVALIVAAAALGVAVVSRARGRVTTRAEHPIVEDERAGST